MMSTYWSYLQFSLAAIIACTALSFAFPKARPACAVVIIAAVALSAMVPGMPLWLRIGCVVVAVAASIRFAVVYRSTPAPGGETR